jgi:hypothetical protein
LLRPGTSEQDRANRGGIVDGGDQPNAAAQQGATAGRSR